MSDLYFDGELYEDVSPTNQLLIKLIEMQQKQNEIILDLEIRVGILEASK